MHRPRSIVGLGWLAMDERPSGVEPSGVAALASLAAVRTGHDARVIGRIGQDRVGDELLAALRTAGVDVAALQLDPDLPTAERRVRADGTASDRIDELESAPDRLQWDFDLEDAARWADVVVFGLESWRSGQARSEELRFLDEAAGAVRAADLTARVPSGRRDADVPRQHLDAAMQHANVALVDPRALSLMRVTRLDGEDAILAAAATVSRQHDATLLVMADDGDVRPMFVVDGRAADPAPRRLRDGGDGGGGVDGGDSTVRRPALAALVQAGVAAVLDASVAAIAGALEPERTAELANPADDDDDEHDADQRDADEDRVAQRDGG